MSFRLQIFYEPSLDEMLADPIVRALMASDGVELEEVQILLVSVAAEAESRERAWRGRSPEA